MAYNSRRGGGGYMATSAASVGQRRPPVHQQKNFQPGGQLMQPNKLVGAHGSQLGMQRPPPQMQQPQQHKPIQLSMVQQRLQRPNLRQQAQQTLQALQQQPPLVATPQPQAPVVQQPQQPKIVFKSEETATNEPPANVANLPPPAAMEGTNGSDDAADAEGGERKPRKNRPFWMRKDGKINKKERLRRRNQRLRKILQPKNALMVLNELIGSAPYNMSEDADLYEGTVFRCTVLVDGTDHIGTGKSKPAAKTAAAEAALKYMVLSKLKSAQSLDGSVVNAISAGVATASLDSNSSVGEDGDIKMEIDTEDNLGGISWSHVACYALHKLLSSWDEGTNLAEKLVQATASSGSILPIDKTKTFEKKPAKKLPETANTMNPIMLLNQMHPNATYEEVLKTGNPPNVQFTIKCTVNGEAFLGTGSTKKGARKMCAFGACRKILGVEYTPEFLEEHGFTEEILATPIQLP